MSIQTGKNDASAPLPVTILTGFLGSGKSTLLNVLLRAPHEQKIAVIVNEFGAVGIDGAMLAGGEQFVELDNGCLCCALNEDLQKTLQDIVARGGIQRIIIETTGIADPLPVAWACTRPELSQQLRVDAIVTLVDARACAQILADYREARVQVERADMLLINKIDLVDDAGALARETVRALNQEAPLFCIEQAQLAWDVLLDADARTPTQMLPEQAPGAGDAHSHGHRHAADALRSWAWTQPVDAGAIDEAGVETLAYAVPAAVIRFKALVFVDAPEGPWLLLHGVAGRIDLRFVTPERAPKSSVFVFFGAPVPQAQLEALCAEHLRPLRRQSH